LVKPVKPRRKKVVTYLNGEGLLEVFEEAVGLELIEVAALGALGLVQLDSLVNERPHLLGLLLAELLGVQSTRRKHVSYQANIILLLLNI
jgi:hypothetical protein